MFLYLSTEGYFQILDIIDKTVINNCQDHPQEKEMQKSKMAVWESLTNTWVKKRNKKQRRKGKK